MIAYQEHSPQLEPVSGALRAALIRALAATSPTPARELGRLLESRRLWKLDSWQIAGAMLQLENIRPADIRVEDLARGLGHICRYSGQVREFYSVASHCLHVASLVPERLRAAALLHDATEAFLGDIASPIKHTPVFALYRDLEALLDAIIRVRFGIYISPVDQAIIKKADQQALVDEAIQLLPYAPIGNWHRKYGEPSGVKLQMLSPAQSEAAYLQALETLGDGWC